MSSSYRLLQNIHHIMTAPVFFELSTCIICTVLELLTVDQSIHDERFVLFDVTIITSITILGLHLSIVFILCLYGEALSAQSLQVTNIIYSNLLWYKLPVQQQQILNMPIRRAQKIFRLKGYGIFDCSMELYLKVKI